MVFENLTSLNIEHLISIISGVFVGGFTLYKYRTSSMHVRSRLKIDLEIMKLAEKAGIEVSGLEENIKDRLAILYQRSVKKRTSKKQKSSSKGKLKLQFNDDVFRGIVLVIIFLFGSVVLLINKLYLGSVIAAVISLSGVSMIFEGYNKEIYTKEESKLNVE